ncbi:MAG: hypothetical protein SH817_00055 [Leptospira sp.]|nr:hypothetical protein [Leptospira sp.]
MKSLLLSILISMVSTSLLAEDGFKIKSNARLFETQIFFPQKSEAQTNPPGWNLQDGFPTQLSNDKRYLNRNTNSFLALGATYKYKTESINVDLDMDIVKRSELGRELLYVGKNSYASVSIAGFWLGIGRRNFIFRKSPFSGYSDGGEGVFLESKIFEHLTTQIFLWDHYRGYSLLEKEYLSPRNLNGESKEIIQSQRRRHSFGLVYEKNIIISFGISYLEFGSWGKQTRELTQNVGKYGADGDSLVNGNFGIKHPIGGFYTQMECLWSKGVDRSPSKTSNTPGSIVIEGEALQLGVGYANDFIHSGISAHVNDSDERNHENQIIKLGYLGTGTHMGSTYFISQNLNMFPSGHFTESGLERNQTIVNGRLPASYGEIFFSINFYDLNFKVTSAILLPYKASGKSDGKISFKKEEYETFYISESSLDISFKRDNFDFGTALSYLTSASELGFKGTIISCYGSAKF